MVEFDGLGTLRVRFPFDRGLVERIKTLPHRRWNAEGRHWTVPEADVVTLVDLLVGERFRLDAATCELYRRMGGTSDLATAPVSMPALGSGFLPLFDPPDAIEEEQPVGPVAVPKASTDYSVSQLNDEVRIALEAAFPVALWLVGEISGFNKSAHRRHVSFHLVECDEAGTKRAEVAATLFERTRAEIEAALEAAGRPFVLEDEIRVRVRVRVELYVPWGSYRVVVEELDVNFTLGEAARRREEIIRRLTAEGLAGRNAALPIPTPPLRVGLITSLGSDACNDVLRCLEESRLAFEVTVHGARVQGHLTEASVLNALDWFGQRAEQFDVLLICRGGGSRTDLAWFDCESLGRAVATHPLPVIVGIGHEQDHSVLDALARRAKTPTAAASLVVDAALTFLANVVEAGREAVALASALVRDERREAAERGRRLVRCAGHRVAQEKLHLNQARRRAAFSGRALLERRRAALGAARRALFQASRRELGAARRANATHAGVIGPRTQRALRAELERIAGRERRLHLADPRRVVERGYSILRLPEGPVVTEASKAPPGTALVAELRAGKLKLRSEGDPS